MKLTGMNKYIYTILIGICMVIIGVFIHQRRELYRYKNLYNKELQNVEAYRVSNSGLEGEIRQYQMTMDDLRASKDSIDRKLSAAIDKLKIKDSKINYLQYQTSIIAKTDTVRFTDTLFIYGTNIDTVLQDNWYQLKLGLNYPSEIIVSPKFNSEKYAIINAKKEYNNKPSKIFFIKWFQKKHTVIEVNVEEKNPYIINKENKFIKIVK